jgi:hypothetical protein
MKKIQLTRGQMTFVSDRDYPRLRPWKWMAAWNERAQTFYAVRSKDGFSMARFILGLTPGMKPDVDHRDHDTLNNQRRNLRKSTPTQNHGNTRLPKNNTSGFKGVYKKRNRWQAKIEVNQQQISLGCFDIPENAARAYDRAARKHFGKFALTNFPRRA